MQKSIVNVSNKKFRPWYRIRRVMFLWHIQYELIIEDIITIISNNCYLLRFYLLVCTYYVIFKVVHFAIWRFLEVCSRWHYLYHVHRPPKSLYHFEIRSTANRLHIVFSKRVFFSIWRPKLTQFSKCLNKYFIDRDAYEFNP